MPLAHILAPQLARKAQEIEDAIGPPRPMNVGYLQAGYEKTPYDPKGIENKKAQSYDSSQGDGREQLMLSIGQMQRSGDPAQQAMARGILEGLNTKKTRPAEIPNAPQARALMVTEAPAPKGRRVIQLPPAGQPAGQTESGVPVDARGRKLGYLDAGPALVTPYGTTPVRTGERKKTDVVVDKDGALPSGDKFGADVMQRQYGADWAAVKENGGKYPPGYFDGMSAAKKKNIQDGVRALQLLERDRPMI